MFRATRLLNQRFAPPLFASRRFIQAQIRSQSKIAQAEATGNAQSVRFRLPGLTPRRLITFAIYTTCITGYLFWVFPEVEIEEVEVVEAEDGTLVPVGAEEDEDEWADEDSRFIPLTWAKKLPKTFYKGSDPEWQEFRKVAKDKQKQQRVMTDLVAILMQGVATHPQISRALGQDAKVGKYWFDTQFPDGPPQEYSRKGIEIGDTFIAWSEQRISAEQQNRNSRLLWPAGTANGIYAFSKTLFGFQYRKVKEMLGMDTKAEPGSHEHRINNMMQMLEAQQAQEASKTARRLGKTQTDPGSSSTGTGITVDPTTPSHGIQSTTPQQPGRSSSDTTKSSSSSNGNPENKHWYMPTLKIGLPGEPMEQAIATAVFAHTLHKSWAPEKTEPPRGTFVVSGLVQMRGSRAAMTFDVQAFYDPKAGRFSTVNVQPRSVKPWRQSPRGGP